MRIIKLSILIAFLLFLIKNANAQGAAEGAQKFGTLIATIEKAYVDDIDADKLVENAIINMLEELDPHSVYISKKDLEKMNEPLVGNFDGVGIQFNIHNDTILVVSAISGGPSEKLGIQSGDKIVYINDSLIAGIGVKNNDVMKLLRGPKGTKVKVGIYRRGVNKILDFNITRDKIPIYSVDAAHMVDDKTAYIKVNRFAAQTLEEFNQGIETLKKQGAKNLILDLRGNSGGYLRTAENMADMFIGDKKLIVYTEGKHQPRNETYSTSKGTFKKGKVVVLIDEGSASASEILAGAIQDWDRGLIVGRRSFGKGLVQKPYMLPDGSAVRLTVSRYYTPSGRSIQKPYENGKEDYNNDALTRFEHGEYFFVDSIQFADSLKYNTIVSKRTVYGGGGIMPDIFVPLDTSFQTTLYRSLLRKGVYNDFSLSYFDKNRKALEEKYSKLDDFNQNFQFPEAYVDEFLAFIAEQEIEYTEEEWKRSEAKIYNLLKAYLARGIFQTSGFYYVINQEDKTFLKGLSLIYDNTFKDLKLSYK